jgi:hypothetical protein
MNKLVGLIIMSCAVAFAGGCAKPASEEQIDAMCQNLAKVTGTLRGTSMEKEKKKIEEEFAFKLKKLKEEKARDLKGWEDVYNASMAELEKEHAPDAGMTPEEKEEKKKEIVARYEKNKAYTEDQFKPDLERHEPRKQIALDKAAEYVAKRKKEAEKYISECVELGKKGEITEEIAACRVTAETEDAWKDCRK